MSRRWARTFPWIAVAMLACVAVAQPAPATAPVDAAALAAPADVEESQRAKVFDGVVDLFRDRYWDPGWMNWDAWAQDHRRAVLSAAARPVFDALMRRMVAAVGDGHSRWLGLSAPEHASLSTQTEGEPPADPEAAPGFGLQTRYLTGVGLVVERVLPGSPADAAGMLRGDVIEGVNGVDLTSINVAGARQAMDEALAREEALLEVRRGARQEAARLLVPASLDQAALELTPYAAMLENGVGYLYLPSFALSGTGARVHSLLAGLAADGASAYVLDLRGNLGGSVAELGVVLGAFVDGDWGVATSRGDVAWTGSVARLPGGGLVASLTEPSGQLVRRIDLDQAVAIRAPLAVLVDGQTGSAAEVAANVLQASGRAFVVGEPTSGNVEVVQGFRLADGSSVLVAVANLRREDGGSMDDGIVPDVPARATLAELAQGLDGAVAAAVGRLVGAPFTPGRWFR